MRILDQLKRVTELLRPYHGQWAICGGVAASIYRNTPRFTDDIDIALVDSPEIAAVDLGLQIMQSLGYEPLKGFVPDVMNHKQQMFGLIAGREGNDQRFIGIDLLLPVQFWVQQAVALAQKNMIDFGFARLPTITPESLVIAKIVALSGAPERYQDLDDISEIVRSLQVDRDSIVLELQRHQLPIPDAVRSILGV